MRKEIAIHKDKTQNDIDLLFDKGTVIDVEGLSFISFKLKTNYTNIKASIELPFKKKISLIPVKKDRISIDYSQENPRGVLKILENGTWEINRYMCKKERSSKSFATTSQPRADELRIETQKESRPEITGSLESNTSDRDDVSPESAIPIKPCCGGGGGGDNPERLPYNVRKVFNEIPGCPVCKGLAGVVIAVGCGVSGEAICLAIAASGYGIPAALTCTAVVAAICWLINNYSVANGEDVCEVAEVC